MSVAAPDYALAGRLLSAYGERLGQEGDDAGAQQALEIAMLIAKQEDDPALEIAALVSAAWVDLYHLRPQEKLEKSLRAIELAERVSDPLPARNAYIHASHVEYNRADLAAARRYAETFVTLSERTGVPAYLASSLYLIQKVAALGGEWQTARGFFERGVREAPHSTMMLVSVQTLVEYAVGDFKQGKALLGRLVEILHDAPPDPHWVHIFVPETIALVARVTGTTHYFDVGREAAGTIIASQRVNPQYTWAARTSLALMAAQQGDIGTVQEQYRAVKGQRGTLIVMDVDRLLGILAAAIGELDQAAIHFEAALTTWGKGRYPEYAWTAYDFAEILLQRGKPDDPSRAAALLNEALAISSELGMGPLKERILLKRQESGAM